MSENVLILKQDTIRLRYAAEMIAPTVQCVVISNSLVKNNKDEIIRIEKLINNMKDKRIINEK